MEPIEMPSTLAQDNVSLAVKTLDTENTLSKSNTYAKTFEFMLDILVYIVFCGREITWKDIQENVTDKHKRTVTRHLEALKELGYLEYRGAATNRIQAFYATEKSKQLFGLKIGTKKK